MSGGDSSLGGNNVGEKQTREAEGLGWSLMTMPLHKATAGDSRNQLSTTRILVSVLAHGVFIGSETHSVMVQPLEDYTENVILHLSYYACLFPWWHPQSLLCWWVACQDPHSKCPVASLTICHSDTLSILRKAPASCLWLRWKHCDRELRNLTFVYPLVHSMHTRPSFLYSSFSLHCSDFSAWLLFG